MNVIPALVDGGWWDLLTVPGGLLLAAGIFAASNTFNRSLRGDPPRRRPGSPRRKR